MDSFAKAYKQLNDAQRQAVDTIAGPMLVLAGPGTGKTQLLSARVANILQKTDALPQNILCLTFTEAAALNMRERLSSMIGEDAYDVHIATYHSFGSDIIRRYPEYFTSVNLETGEDTRLEQPIDDLTKTQIVSEIVNKLAYDDPLRSARHYIKSVVSTISDVKKSLITPSQLRTIAKSNLESVTQLSPKIDKAMDGLASTRKFDQSLTAFSNVLTVLHSSTSELSVQASSELETALEESESTRKTTPLTAWKNTWLSKDDKDRWLFTNVLQHQKIMSLASVFEAYQTALEHKSLYDFDDMIIKTIETLKANDELRFNLQEQYQYILLDEFQDTNPAQFEMVYTLANHPVHEGRPNIMAVGDDDQAIYAFQGAQVSNMLKFTSVFTDVSIINLNQNYRSHADILHVAHEVGSQIESRLHHQLEGIEKNLHAAQTKLPKKATIERHEFAGQANEYAWVAARVKELVDTGTAPNEIVVLSPKHRLLEELVPFLNSKKLPVTYEKRENILETPIVKQLELIAKLICACADMDTTGASALFPQVLSFAFWNIDVEHIWKVNWQYAKYDETRTWAEIALEHEPLRNEVLCILALAAQSDIQPLEYTLDAICGVTDVSITQQETFRSPFKQFYFDGEEHLAQSYFETLAHLSVIREQLRSYQRSQDDLLTIRDFLTFIQMYRDAEQPLINSHPIAQADSSVQLMTVYKAKGLEFEYVFLLSVHDDVWGKKSRSDSNKIGLPANLRYIRYHGSDEDELRRLLFVAITRAKHGLYMTSHARKDSGKQTEPVKYLREQTNEHGSRVLGILPESAAEVIRNDHLAEQAHKDIELLWEQRNVELTPSLKHLLQERLDRYAMSPTHLNSFIDLEYAGPQEFLLRTLLRFPSAPTTDGEFGTAIHQSLEWYQKQPSHPSIKELLGYFDTCISKHYIPKTELANLQLRGRRALTSYVTARQKMFSENAASEVDFRSEGAVLKDVRLSGKIDRLEIDQKARTLRIVDYKTGEAFDSWKRNLKLHKYRQQLYFYKLLLEKSHTYQDYKVIDARLEFVEPREAETVVEPLVLVFDEAEYKEIQRLITAVWKHIQALDLPNTTTYGTDLSGIRAFESYLLES